ncbi:hypothetical protein H3N56_11780 [Cetobacterium sp. 2A]|uniref:CD0519/CD1768 family membrane protein n=1 Tax=Cetobacterium sp. 2A TaxID=2754723 RepID=UPI00163C71CF|nr:hypothetical protein [Cetobacterium sp. 2A]MBC2857113.1 hypothetical protein [Cetobacterium sp. 2A]
MEILELKSKERQVAAISKETFVVLIIFISLFTYLGKVMGIDKVFSVMMKTGHDVLMNTSFYIMAVAILAGAVASIMSEFGIVALINKLISPLMRPLFGLPGAAALGAVTTYISDNPAILGLAEDQGFNRYFTKAEKVTYTNLGTTFGMGLIVTAYMLSLGSEYFKAVLIGNLGAVIGGVFSVRMVLRYAKKFYNEPANERIEDDKDGNVRNIRGGSSFERLLASMMDGAKSGVTLGLACASGTVLICTFVMILTFGPQGPNGSYLGVAYEGVQLLPKIGSYFTPIAKILWGFGEPELLAYPFTALGAVGSAMGLTKGFIDKGLASANTIAVFTGMGICWSGFLSTHVGMLDTLKHNHFIKIAILWQLIGGLIAGVAANYLFKLTLMF